MRLVPRALAVSVASTCLASGALAAVLSVSHSVGGVATAGLHPNIETKPFAEVDSFSLRIEPDASSIELDAYLSEEVTVGGGTGAAFVQCYETARIGHATVRLTAITSGVNAAGSGGGGTVYPSIVEAGWTDSMMFSSDLLPPGFPLFVEGTLLVTGSAEARVIGGPVGGFRLGLAQAGLKVFPVGFVMTPPYPGGYYAYTADDLAHTQTASLPAPETLAIALLTINKQSVATGFTLSLTGQANSSSGITSAGSVGASFDADFSRTLKWGGITRVTNSETGEEIADWTVTSESGFDYSKPFEVPEPSRPFAFAAVASGLALRTRRDRLPRQRRE